MNNATDTPFCPLTHTQANSSIHHYQHLRPQQTVSHAQCVCNGEPMPHQGTGTSSPYLLPTVRKRLEEHFSPGTNRDRTIGLLKIRTRPVAIGSWERRLRPPMLASTGSRRRRSRTATGKRRGIKGQRRQASSGGRGETQCGDRVRLLGEDPFEQPRERPAALPVEVVCCCVHFWLGCLSIKWTSFRFGFNLFFGKRGS